MLGVPEAFGQNLDTPHLTSPLARAQLRASSSRPLFSGWGPCFHVQSTSCSSTISPMIRLPRYAVNLLRRSTVKNVTLHPSAWHVKVPSSVRE